KGGAMGQGLCQELYGLCSSIMISDMWSQINENNEGSRAWYVVWTESKEVEIIRDYFSYYEQYYAPDYEPSPEGWYHDIEPDANGYLKSPSGKLIDGNFYYINERGEYVDPDGENITQDDFLEEIDETRYLKTTDRNQETRRINELIDSSIHDRYEYSSDSCCDIENGVIWNIDDCDEHEV